MRFFKDGRKIQHSDPYLEDADCVSITFEWQKKDEINDMLTQLALEHIILCLVREWATLVKRIRKYPESTGGTPVSAVWENNKIEHVTSSEIVSDLRDAVPAIVEYKLGFKAEQVGTHSQISGAAMKMYLEECLVYTIMMIGRWYSDTFLRYIIKQVNQFSHNVSSRMIQLKCLT